MFFIVIVMVSLKGCFADQACFSQNNPVLCVCENKMAERTSSVYLDIACTNHGDQTQVNCKCELRLHKAYIKFHLDGGELLENSAHTITLGNQSVSPSKPLATVVLSTTAELLVMRAGDTGVCLKVNSDGLFDIRCRGELIYLQTSATTLTTSPSQKGSEGDIEIGYVIGVVAVVIALVAVSSVIIYRIRSVRKGNSGKEENNAVVETSPEIDQGPYSYCTVNPMYERADKEPGYVLSSRHGISSHNDMNTTDNYSPNTELAEQQEHTATAYHYVIIERNGMENNSENNVEKVLRVYDKTQKRVLAQENDPTCEEIYDTNSRRGKGSKACTDCYQHLGPFVVSGVTVEDNNYNQTNILRCTNYNITA